MRAQQGMDFKITLMDLMDLQTCRFLLHKTIGGLKCVHLWIIVIFLLAV